MQAGYAYFSDSDRSYSGRLNLNYSQYTSPAGEMRVRLYRAYRSSVPMTIGLDLFKLTKN